MVAYHDAQIAQDEGYSEDPLTQPSSAAQSLAVEFGPHWLNNIAVEDRARLAMNIINGLPTSTVCDIVEALRPRLFINFFQRLPPEVCLKILGYLDPVSLLSVASAGREALTLAYDWKLWQHLYYLEGWRIIPSELRKFESEWETKQLTSRSRPDLDSDSQQANKRRATSQRMNAVQRPSEDLEMADVDSPRMEESMPSSIFGPAHARPTVASPEATDSMKLEPSGTSDTSSANIGDLYIDDPGSISKGKAREDSSRLGTDSNISRKQSVRSYTSRGGVPSNFASSITIRDRMTGKPKLNWQYLYAQRRRLESNWEAARFVNFQLPHPDYPHEAHDECIYTIQYCGKYLVSGSRDRSVRIWDLDTRRLVRPPLLEHRGSVLCLQFDASPDEDIIVSGSSDSNVIIWRFSTGEIIQRLKKAHRESVLNVRFDRRILATCSKDKTIKIFNRRPMGPGEMGYPHGRGVNPVPTVLNNYGFNPSPADQLPIKPPYTMIGCLDGHGAAVNAVQIYDNEIVSASGDRNVKIWDWPSQTCTRTLMGHHKGIACVQYDGRRVVSGSSDNEVKVFDKHTGIEVASLKAHTNLVRTVQAGFGDLPYSLEEDQEAARRIDNEFFKAVESGEVTTSSHSTRSRPRNAGSHKPEDITAYGAKLPPGGGGGRYGRIVSGSYDETIIIWRRDKTGAWKARHLLRQEHAAQAAARQRSLVNPSVRASASGRIAQHFADGAQGSGSGTSGDGPAFPAAQTRRVTPETPLSQASIHSLIDQTVPHGYIALRQLLQQYPYISQSSHLQAAIAAENSSATRVALRQEVLRAQQIVYNQQVQASLVAEGTGSGSSHGHHHGVAHASHVATAGSASSAGGHGALPGSGIHSGTGSAASSLQLNHLHPHMHSSNMARVFKLQFDARRIICCSQTPVIVGWDFANGDEKIVEASRFFAPVE